MKRQELEKERENLRTVFRKMFSITEDAASNEEIRDRILSGGKVTGTNMVVMICAILIASVGLNTNSVAVIIGAMLISPLMGSILAIAYGTASNDAYLMKRHSVGFAVQILMSVAAATIYFLLSPIKEPTEQLLARTNPNFFDVIIALSGGIAGIVGQTRQDKSNNIIPGVAIATALMPPLCTCGYAIANGNLRMLLGAFYLFIINAYFIYVASNAMLVLLGTSNDAAGMETTAQKDVPQYIACAAADHSDRSRLEHLRQCRRSFERTTKTLNCFSEPFSVFSFLCL